MDREIARKRMIVIGEAEHLNQLPMIERLENVKNMLFDDGGDKDSTPCDPSKAIAVEVLSEVIQELKRSPALRKSRKSSPDPS
jgi:hypothetical protein